MSDTITYDHDDPEARRGKLTIYLHALDCDDLAMQAWDIDRCGRLTIRLTDDEAIGLYETLRASWAGYLAERDEAAAAVRAGVPLSEFIEGWKNDTIEGYCTAQEWWDTVVELDDSGAADLARDLERGK